MQDLFKEHIKSKAIDAYESIFGQNGEFLDFDNLYKTFAYAPASLYDSSIKTTKIEDLDVNELSDEKVDRLSSKLCDDIVEMKVAITITRLLNDFYSRVEIKMHNTFRFFDKDIKKSDETLKKISRIN